MGRIDRKKFEKISKSITTDEVIITDERIKHIKDGHSEDYEKYNKHIPEILVDPDYILRDKKPYTGILLKEFSEEGKHFQLILRLNTTEDEVNYKNSVITFLKIKEARFERYLRTKTILYKKDE